MKDINTNNSPITDDVRDEVRSLIDNAIKLGLWEITATFLLTPRGWETFAALAEEIKKHNFQSYNIQSKDGEECHIGIFLK